MMIFRDIEDVTEWLVPLDYIAFWDAIAPYGVFTLADRDHCDGLIAGGKVAQDLILECLKGEARRSLTNALALKHRRHQTHQSQAIASLH